MSEATPLLPVSRLRGPDSDTFARTAAPYRWQVAPCFLHGRPDSVRDRSCVLLVVAVSPLGDVGDPISSEC
jgi:hypothetical protein